MPFNGSGTFTIVNTFVPNTTILSAAVNQNFTDIATGLSDCLTRDGQAGMTAAFKAIAGSIGAPSITFSSDATSGLYLAATGVPALVSHSLGLQVNTAVYQAQSATVQAGGSNYAVGDTITLTGGTATTQAVLTVATLTGSAVATATVTYPGIYTAAPSNPVSQGSTSGIGSGATFNVTFNDPGAADYRAAILDQASGLLWQKLGASSFVSGLMSKANGFDFATGIGSSNLVSVISGSFILPPAGRLTLTSGTPVLSGDVSAATRLYWTPYAGNGCPIYNGTAFVNTTSPEIFADLTAGAQASGGIYDVYKFLVAGTVTLGFSPSWSAGTSGSVTAGSCARGTSTGGTAITYLSGIPTNAVAMTLNNGSTTYNISANQATYLGSAYINSTAGQLNYLIGYGQSRVIGVWNAWNRVPLAMKAGDTGSWNYTTATFRPANNSTANSLTIFAGLREEEFDLWYMATYSVNASGGGPKVGVGYNSTTSASGYNGAAPSAPVAGALVALNARYLAPPALGINVVTALESGAGANTTTWYGTEASMQLTASYRG